MGSDLKVFTPHKIGNVKIRNRFVRSATYMRSSNRKGEVTEDTLKIFGDLAKNDLGVIISGYMYVSKSGLAAPKQLGIYDDSLISGLKKLALTVKDYGAAIFAQIAHGGRQSLMKESDSIAPSSIPDKFMQRETRKMNEEDIKTLVNDFIASAKRAYVAELDGVQLHCAHGYLLSLFLSPYANKRADSYGGSIENRTRIIEEITMGIQDELGKSFPIIAKVNISDFVKDPNQLTIDESKLMMKRMADFGIAAIEPSGGFYESAMYGNVTAMRIKIRTLEDEAYFLPEAKIIKKEVGDVPVMVVGGIRSLVTAEKIINEGLDFVSLSRPLIREPDLIKKWKEGKSDKADCISCGRCLIDMSPRPVECSPLKKKLQKLKSHKEKN